MRTKRILALSTILAISALGAGLASADPGDRRGKRFDRTQQNRGVHKRDRVQRRDRAHRPNRAVNRRGNRGHVRTPDRRHVRRPARRANRTPARRHYNRTPARRYNHRRARVYRPARRAYRPVRRPVWRTYVTTPGYTFARFINKLMYEADLDGDGYISRWEARRHHRLRGKFGLINRNYDGVITRVELRLFFG